MHRKPIKPRAKRSCATPVTEIDPLAVLLPRHITARILGGKSIAYVKRLEEKGILKVVRPNKTARRPQAFNIRAEVERLTSGGDDE
jgi:hypothetical protein